MTVLLDGASLAKQAEGQIATRVRSLTQSGFAAPALVTVLVGDDPASATYVRMKRNACKRVGIGSQAHHLSGTSTTEEVLTTLEQLNADERISGILLQHPMPSQIDERACFDRIEALKDVDGVTASGFGRMSLGSPAWGSCTPAGIMRLLRHYEIPLSGRRAVVVGRSPILGRPMAMMLLAADATVTICHSRTENLQEEVRRAQILVAAVGRPRFIPADWIAPDAVVIDAGFHPQERVGDVDLQALGKQCAAYTPVPGGVGPMTINTLLLQTLYAAEQSAGLTLPPVG